MNYETLKNALISTDQLRSVIYYNSIQAASPVYLPGAPNIGSIPNPDDNGVIQITYEDGEMLSIFASRNEFDRLVTKLTS